MNEVLLYIGMLVMMAIILIFIVILFSSFIKSKSSFDYFNNLMHLAGSACISPQSTTYLQFNSPNSVVIQIYDSKNCNSSLYSDQQNDYFSSSYPYNGSASLLNTYMLCYAQLTSSVSGSGQFYASLSSYQYSESPYCYYSGLSICNSLQNGMASSGYPQITVEFDFASLTISPSGLYSFSLPGSSTYPLSLVNISFYNKYKYSAPCYSNVYYPSTKFDLSGEINFSKVCGGVTSVNVTFISSQTPTNSNLFNISLSDLVLTPLDLSSSSLGFNSGTCGTLAGMISTGDIKRGSLVCEPIYCNSQNYVITDQNGNPLEAIQNEQYGFFEVESGPTGTLQVINPNPEQLGSYYG